MIIMGEMKREISISWFANLTGLLGKYLAVLRYELEQFGEAQTIEALIHAEIAKILIRQFTPGCVVTEYPIGALFSQGKREDGSTFARKFRAEIALFHPVKDPSSSLPMSVFELKREGGITELVDDIYRLVIVSLRTNATGYFIFAGPAEHVQSTIAGVSILQKLNESAEKNAEKDEPQEFSFADLTESGLYNSEDHVYAEKFFGQRMFGEENNSEADPYQVRIFAFHVSRDIIVKKEDQRVSLALHALKSTVGAVEPLPLIEE